MPWPIEVVILDDKCNVSSEYGTKTKGLPSESFDNIPSHIPDHYPNSVEEWARWEFQRAWPDNTHNDELSPHLLSLKYWTKYNIVAEWTDYMAISRCPIVVPLLSNDYSRYPMILTRPPYAVAQWNYRIRLRYNLTWALLGYTEGQPQPIPKLALYINGDPSLPPEDKRHHPCPVFDALSTSPPPPPLIYRESYAKEKIIPKRGPVKKVQSKNKYSVS